MTIKRFTVELPENIHQQLKLLSLVSGKSMKEFILEKIKEALEEEKKKGNIPDLQK